MKGRRIIRDLLGLIGLLWVQTTVLWAQDTQTPPTAAPAPPSLSPVILAENSGVVQRFGVDAGAARSMVNSALLKLTSARDISTAWKRLGVTPDDVVGIKITTMGGPLLSSHRAVVQAICDGLQAAGLSPSHIVIWDKMGDDMRRAGYLPASGDDSQVRIGAIFPGAGYDPSVVYKNEIIGNLIWGDYDFIRSNSYDDLFASTRRSINSNPAYGSPLTADDNAMLGDDSPGVNIPQTSTRSYYTRYVTSICTKIINVPVLTDNAYTGINGCLASLALGCVDNNRRFQGDPTYGDPAICEILDKDFMRRKVIVHILDALVAEYAGGPRFNPQFTQSIGALYVSRDPVAIDSLVLPRLEQWRRQNQIDPIGKTASHIQSATYYNLGTTDPRRIQLIRLP